MQIAILNGISSNFRRQYPINLVPVPVDSGISNGYFRPADGIVSCGTGPGRDRGGINWNNDHYRVMGGKLCKIKSCGSILELGDIPGNDPVVLDYSFDRLAIAANGHLYYWDNVELTEVTDGDLGIVKDFCWVDGYFMTTDGTYLVVTELNDPTSVNPLKYGSSEADPDPIKSLVKIRNEVYALNRYTIEVFDNVGGELFPFARIEGAQVQKGCIGRDAACVYMDTLAFVGGGRNESPAVYIGSNAQAGKLSTREIDEILLQYTEEELSTIKLESRTDRANNFLYVHLPDRTLVYDGPATQTTGVPVWFILTSSTDGFSRYRAWNFVWVDDKWYCGDPTSPFYGYLDDSVGSHYTYKVRWEFNTQIIYNSSRGAIFNELELVVLPSSNDIYDDPTISTCYSLDGAVWSQERYTKAGRAGQRTKRIVWYRNGCMYNYRIQKFKGDSDAHMYFARLEAQIEPLGA